MRWSEKATHSNKPSYSCFDEINACAVVFFPVISFRVVFILHFITRNKISFLSKWPQWNNILNECHFVLYQVNRYKKMTKHWNENISFHLNWNLNWNGWVFVYELSGCGSDSHCSHLTYKYRACFEQEFIDIQ